MALIIIIKSLVDIIIAHCSDWNVLCSLFFIRQSVLWSHHCYTHVSFLFYLDVFCCGVVLFNFLIGSFGIVCSFSKSMMRLDASRSMQAAQQPCNTWNYHLILPKDMARPVYHGPMNWLEFLLPWNTLQASCFHVYILVQAFPVLIAYIMGYNAESTAG